MTAITDILAASIASRLGKHLDCPDKKPDEFEPENLALLSALASASYEPYPLMGGKPKYATNEERLAARRASKSRYYYR